MLNLDWRRRSAFSAAPSTFDRDRWELERCRYVDGRDGEDAAKGMGVWLRP